MATPPTVTPKGALQPPFYDPPITNYPSGQQHSQAWTEYHQSVSDQLASIQQSVARGVTDGSDAAAGAPGEYMTATASGVALVNNTPINVVSLDLTAGDWDVSGNVDFAAGSGQHAFFGVGIDTIDTSSAATYPSTVFSMAMTTATHRYNLTATQTVVVVAVASFLGSVTADGGIRARRVR